MENYKKIKMLGKGTYGAVYLCQKKNHKSVLKEINKHLTDAVVQAANNEIQVLKTLSHPNIIQYHNHFISKSCFYILMEYATKGNLFEFITNHRNNSTYICQEKILNIYCQILLGLNHIHSKQIIHRDLKCENILLTGSKYDLIKIADFGISKILESSEHTHTVIGTPNYLAPEICDARPYGLKSDIWSLGCVLYELCALERMFEGNISNVVLSIARGIIKQINLTVYDFKLQEIINISLSLDQNLRPSTIDLIGHPTLFLVTFNLLVDLGKIEG